MAGKPAWNGVFIYTAPGRHVALRQWQAFRELPAKRLPGQRGRKQAVSAAVWTHITCLAVLLPPDVECQGLLNPLLVACGLMLGLCLHLDNVFVLQGGGLWPWVVQPGRCLWQAGSLQCPWQEPCTLR